MPIIRIIAIILLVFISLTAIILAALGEEGELDRIKESMRAERELKEIKKIFYVGQQVKYINKGSSNNGRIVTVRDIGINGTFHKSAYIETDSVYSGRYGCWDSSCFSGEKLSQIRPISDLEGFIDEYKNRRIL